MATTPPTGRKRGELPPERKEAKIGTLEQHKVSVWQQIPGFSWIYNLFTSLFGTSAKEAPRAPKGKEISKSPPQVLRTSEGVAKLTTPTPTVPAPTISIFFKAEQEKSDIPIDQLPDLVTKFSEEWAKETTHKRSESYDFEEQQLTSLLQKADTPQTVTELEQRITSRKSFIEHLSYYDIPTLKTVSKGKLEKLNQALEKLKSSLEAHEKLDNISDRIEIVGYDPSAPLARKLEVVEKGVIENGEKINQLDRELQALDPRQVDIVTKNRMVDTVADAKVIQEEVRKELEAIKREVGG